MKKIFAIVGMLLLVAVAFAEATIDKEKYVVVYNGVTPTNFSDAWYKDYIDLLPGESVVFRSPVIDKALSKFFQFAKLVVLDNYKVQLYIKDYSNPANKLVGEWKAVGLPVKNNETKFSDEYTYGFVISDSEQESTGIEFHNYYVTFPEGVNKYNQTKADFEKRLAEEPTIPVIVHTECKTFSECLARIDKNLYDNVLAKIKTQ